MSQFPAAIDLATLDGSDGFRLDGIDAGDNSGHSVASAGDVNGDGFDDVIIGAQYASPGGTLFAGRTYVVFGKPAGFTAAFDLDSLDGTNGFRLDGIDIRDHSGASVASAGDMNGDGFDDVIIGAFRGDPGGDVDAGESYVVFGKASGFSAAIDLSTLDGATGFRLDGIDAGDFSGRSVASAGDVNGDGFDDAVIGADGADPGGDAEAGESYVVFGKAAGFAATLDLDTLDGTNGFRVDGINATDRIGLSVASAGDVNGDGFDDMIFGTDRGDPIGDANAGETYVVFGKASGFTATLDLSTLNGATGFRLDGIDASDGSGISATSAGDVNADGFDDMIVGAHRADPGGDSDAGESYVVFGKASGFAAAIDLDTLDGTDGFRLDGIDALDQSGQSAAAAGDVNGDGFDDVIVGAYKADPGGDSGAGESYVVFGKASGFAASLDLAGLDGSDGFRVDGIDVNDFSGTSVAAAGDVNNDGFDDLIVGADGADPGGDLGAGESYVVFGRKPDAAVILIGTVADQTLAGGDFDDRLSGRGGDDELWGHGGRDRLNGGAGADTMRGGGGDDRYTATSIDTIVELDGEGVDEVRASGNFTLDEEVENLTLTAAALEGTGNGDGNFIAGNGESNVLAGLGGDDTLDGGSDGDDVLDGGPGNDIMTGGIGDDTYTVSSASDTVTELAGEGTDEVRTSLDYTLDDNVENLTLFGGGAVDGTGNNLGNFIDGNGAANTLTGLGASDRLDGKAGADTLIGSTGDEIYTFDDAGDTAVELAGEGTDEIRSTVAVTLGDFVSIENGRITSVDDVALTGSGADNVLTGGNGDNAINGSGGIDTIRGNFGADTLTGASGEDIFTWIGINESVGVNRDTVTDFVTGDDLLDFTAIDADTTQAGDQDFALDADGSFSAGEIRLTLQGADLLLEANTDAGADVETAVLFLGIATLVAGDFL